MISNVYFWLKRESEIERNNKMWDSNTIWSKNICRQFLFDIKAQSICRLYRDCYPGPSCWQWWSTERDRKKEFTLVSFCFVTQLIMDNFLVREAVEFSGVKINLRNNGKNGKFLQNRAFFGRADPHGMIGHLLFFLCRSFKLEIKP